MLNKLYFKTSDTHILNINLMFNLKAMYLKRLTLSLLLFVFITRVIAAEKSPIILAVSQKAPIHIHLNLKSEQIGFVQKGSKVEALFQTGLTYQIKTQDGNIGWVGYENFEETKELQEAINSYWSSDLLVSPLTYFNSMKMLKNRIYSS